MASGARYAQSTHSGRGEAQPPLPEHLCRRPATDVPRAIVFAIWLFTFFQQGFGKITLRAKLILSTFAGVNQNLDFDAEHSEYRREELPEYQFIRRRDYFI
jgi:hypothetical protein